MKSRTPSFVIELGLKTGEDQESALETYFSDARQLFNAVLGTAKKRVRAMKSTDVCRRRLTSPYFPHDSTLSPDTYFCKTALIQCFQTKNFVAKLTSFSTAS